MPGGKGGEKQERASHWKGWSKYIEKLRFDSAAAYRRIGSACWEDL